MAETLRLTGEPESPATVRAEIEETRARMSATIDEIEDVLVEKKERIRQQLDLLGRVREKPLQAAGVVFGAGLLLGLLSGGGRKARKAAKSARRRSEMWEERARHLLEIAQAQEAEIEALEEAARRNARGSRLARLKGAARRRRGGEDRA